MSQTQTARPFTGRHMLLIMLGFFAVVLTANMTMVYFASHSWSGLVVKNSYVASQEFDSERKAQLALGWTLTPTYDQKLKELELAFTDADGNPVKVASLEVLVGRTTEAADDSYPEFARESGVYVAKADLGPGKWMMHVEARAEDGTRFHQRINLFVKS